MSLSYESLDARTREFMASELTRDVASEKLYISGRLSDQGKGEWADLLRMAILSHDDAWLSEQLRSRGFVNATEQRRKPTGGFSSAKVPVTAAETLSEGEFNRFYARGVCARAIADGQSEVEIYRAKAVINPRPGSEALLGLHRPAGPLLEDLRNSQGVEPALGVPPGPNSGISVRLLR